MKLSISPKRSTRGSAMLICLVTGALMLISAASYLTVVNHQNYMSARSQAWNTSITVVEAGIEEAMEHLNVNTNRMATEGWGFDGQCYVLDHDMGDGNGYSVSIDMTNPEEPEVTSRAFSTLDGGPITPIFAAMGMEGERVTLSRAVKIRASRGGLYIKGMVAKEKVDMNGNNILTDSYDSGDPAKSTGQQYDPTKAGNKGDVSVNSSIINGIHVGNANIYGKVATGPRGSVAVGSGGGVGEKSWVASHPGQIQPGYYSDDMNFTFPEITLPYTTALQPLPGTVVTVSNYVVEVPQTGVPGPGMDGVITNMNYDYSSTYPGQVSGLITNLVWNNTTVPPSGPVHNNTINTNLIQMNSSEWPGTSFGQVTTNIFWETSLVYPGPKPSLRTNVTLKTATFLPSPLPAGPITTNTAVAKSKTYPSAGSYIGTPMKIQGWWTYNLITGYTWRVLEYLWPIREYVWNEPHYLFQTAVYGVPNFTYQWNTFTTNTVYFTNQYDRVLYSGDYVVNTLSGKTYVVGPSRLVVLSDVRMSGQDVLRIGPNGSLHMWVDGVNSAISGNGVINESGLAANCIIEFTYRVRNLSFDGNGEFIGVIVAPGTDMALNGGGSTVTDFSGAVIGNTITLLGNFKFHYDEALGRLPRNGRYLVNSWDEIKADTAFTFTPMTSTTSTTSTSPL